MAAQLQKRCITCSNEKGPGKHSWHCVAATAASHTHRWLHVIKADTSPAQMKESGPLEYRDTDAHAKRKWHQTVSSTLLCDDCCTPRDPA
eukprot:scaffold91612_cov28-Tisochrysis_lutea.AAC.1